MEIQKISHIFCNGSEAFGSDGKDLLKQVVIDFAVVKEALEER